MLDFNSNHVNILMIIYVIIVILLISFLAIYFFRKLFISKESGGLFSIVLTSLTVVLIILLVIGFLEIGNRNYMNSLVEEKVEELYPNSKDIVIEGINSGYDYNFPLELDPDNIGHHMVYYSVNVDEREYNIGLDLMTEGIEVYKTQTIKEEND